VSLSSVMSQQLLRKSVPLSLCHVPLENWPVGLCGCCSQFFGGSDGVNRITWRFCAGEQW
jgi:hypothetical protein